MSESQFAYSGLTLDELRSLAASPQVGTLHAMPQSFRALADRVGEVADLLTHTQLNMHHWWKGPAAEQAAAMLGQAAAEAREFHDTAMGAATAVGHCAQIVSEQQHQMMNVPDVAEPGVTDVVPRPTTPFEALEAARRDAAYQAAHEQAVQVVNGIAAQYVETRTRLSTISASSGANFTIPLAPQLSAQPAVKSSALESNSAIGEEFSRSRQFTQGSRLARSRGPFSSEVQDYHLQQRLTAEPSTKYARSSSARKAPPLDPHAKGLATGPQGALNSSEISGYARPPKEQAWNETGQPQVSKDWLLPEETTIENNEPHQRLGISKFGTPNESSGAVSAADTRRNTVHPWYFSAQSADGSELDKPAQHDGWQSAPLFPYHSQSDAANADSAASSIIPPYGGVGSVHRLSEGRNSRPSYLKERKSAWIIEKIAAPPNGVLSPEWFEQS